MATGKKTSVREFCRMAFEAAGVNVSFKGKNEKEIGIVEAVTNPEIKLNPGQTVVEIDPRYYRPTEVELLVGDASKAKEKLGWQPTYTLSELVKEMVASDLELFRKDILLKQGGFNIIRPAE